MKRLFLTFVLLYATNSLAAVYKCSDANGRVMYSDTVCDAKANREAIDVQALAEVKAHPSFLSGVMDKFKSFFRNTTNTEQASSAAPSNSANEALNARCDGRTHCSQMTSCEEATFFIKHCPNTEMDGDNDGVPCEKQWCQ